MRRRTFTVILAVVVTAAVAVGLAATLGAGPGTAGATALPTASAVSATGGGATRRPAASAALPPIRHVFIIVLENESAESTFPASGTAPAPYLADTMRSEGAYLPNYYAVGHNSNDNYIAMISGQAPNLQNSEDCLLFDNFTNTASTGPPYDEQKGTGCVYPADIQNIATQLDAAGLSWKDYNQSMGDTPSREAAECGHPAVGSFDGTQTETAQDAYATRHNPFVYFHSIIDDTTLCDTHVVNLDALAQDLQSPASTPNYVFITPDLCGDGHDATCADKSRAGGFAGINGFLSEYVPMILNSPAFKEQNGLLITTFDEASTSDTSSCCGEIPGPGEAHPGLSGSGGGRVGAVAISPCITPGTVDGTAYNHYALLGSIENIFGLPRLGYAQLPGESYFGSDLFTRSCSSAPPLSFAVPSVGGLTAPLSTRAPVATLRFASTQPGATYTVQRRLNGTGAWRTLESGATTGSYRLALSSGVTYDIRVRATNQLGLSSPWLTRSIVVPTLAQPAGATLSGVWHNADERGALRGRVLVGRARATYRFDYTGAHTALIATRDAAGGEVTVSLDGHVRRISVHAGHLIPQQTIYSGGAAEARHRLIITVDSGTLTLEGLAITDLR